MFKKDSMEKSSKILKTDYKEDKKLAERVFSEASLKYGVVYSHRLAMKRRLDEIDKLDDVDSKNQINNPLEDGPF